MMLLVMVLLLMLLLRVFSPGMLGCCLGCVSVGSVAFTEDS